jgi:hypothetical protein
MAAIKQVNRAREAGEGRNRRRSIDAGGGGGQGCHGGSTPIRWIDTLDSG